MYTTNSSWLNTHSSPFNVVFKTFVWRIRKMVIVVVVVVVVVGSNSSSSSSSYADGRSPPLYCCCFSEAFAGRVADRCTFTAYGL